MPFRKVGDQKKKENLRRKIDSFIEEEICDEKSSKTISAYRRIPFDFVNQLKDGQEVTKKDILAYKDHLIKKYKLSTVNVYLTILNKFIKYCEVVDNTDEFDFTMLKKHYSKNVVKNIRIQAPDSLDDILNPSDFKRMRRKAKEKGDMRTYLILSVYGFTGIRAKEIDFFTVDALKASKDFVQVRNKGKTRKVPVPGTLRRDLLRYAKENHIDSGPIFRNPDGQPLSYSRIYRCLKDLAGECRGIKKSKVHPHSFRHLFAYYFLEGNESRLAELADILGHSSLETTRIYLRTTIKMKKQKMERIRY